jgi:hypothetical protein
VARHSPPYKYPVYSSMQQKDREKERDPARRNRDCTVDQLPLLLARTCRVPPEMARSHRAEQVGPDYRTRSVMSAVMNVCPVWHPMQKW